MRIVTRALSLPFVALTAAGSLLAGSAATAQAADLPRVGELGGPGRELAPAELAQWLRGRDLFDRPMHRSRGLGAPEMNGDSCRACHQDPVLGGSGALELNVSRAAKDNGGSGPFSNVSGGQGISKLYPAWLVGREEIDDEADVYEQRQTPPLFGSGLIESVLEAEILANEDPNDADGNGVRGVARWVDIGGTLELGRFGWKNQVPKIEDFVRDAMGGELGITTPDDGRGFAMASDADTVADPELTPSEVQDLAFFMRELAAPQRRHPTGPAILLGEALFASVGCADCHVPVLQGTGGPVALYSDLLLHDVMPDNYRGMEEPGAGAGVFGTPPLWGIRFTAPYLHDGRAETLDDAIRMHAGEADGARTAYEALSSNDQALLLRFLRDL